MKKIISVATASVLFLSLYFIPSASAIKLGEIKPDKSHPAIGKEKTVQSDDPKKKVPEKKEIPREKPDDKEKINPRLVCLLSVLMPGGGHFYLNNDVKGMSFCLAAGIGYTATGFFMVKTMLAETGSAEYKNYLLLSGFFLFISLIIHIVGIIEAYTDAEEINKEKLFKNEKDNPLVTEFIKK